MTIHHLKTWTEFFRAVKSGEKPFEIRFNDRNYQVGDTLILLEHCPDLCCETGDRIVRRVTYITAFPAGLRDGYVVMGLGRE